MLRYKFLISLSMLLAWVCYAHAEPLPKWEFGLGLAAFNLPQYRGADQQKTYLLPFPYIKYRGDYIKIDEKGGHLDIFKSERLKLDLSLSAAPPVDSDENNARRGMPDLDPSIEIGAQFSVLLTKNLQDTINWRLVFPLRSVYATDLKHIEQIGWVFAPFIQFEHNANWHTSLAIGPLFATQKYHNYYYQVDSLFATANRPAFTTNGGYSGSRITITHGKRFQKFWVTTFLRYDNLSDAVFEDSPLVKRNSTFIAGASIAWILYKSKSTTTH